MWPFYFLLLFNIYNAMEIHWHLVKSKAILKKQFLLGGIFGNMLSEKQFMLLAWGKNPPVDKSALDSIYSSTERCGSPPLCSPLMLIFRIIVCSKGNYKSQTWSHSAVLLNHWFVFFWVMEQNSWIYVLLFFFCSKPYFLVFSFFLSFFSFKSFCFSVHLSFTRDYYLISLW